MQVMVGKNIDGDIHKYKILEVQIWTFLVGFFWLLVYYLREGFKARSKCFGSFKSAETTV